MSEGARGNGCRHLQNKRISQAEKAKHRYKKEGVQTGAVNKS
jgi:hypothetical protein